MNKLISIVLMIFCIGSYSIAAETKHILIAVDNGNNSLHYVNQFDPDRNWTVNTDNKPRDIHLSEDMKTILISVDTGAVEYDLSSGKRTGISIVKFKGIQSAQKMKDGNYLLATDKTIFVCGPTGKKMRDIPVVADSTPYIRIVTVTKENTLLYTAIEPCCINEMDMNGKVIAMVTLPEKSYKALRLKNGNYLASAGVLSSVFELTPAGLIVKTYGGKENHPELELSDTSGWQQLPNGNVVVACWHGHGYEGNGPHLVEYDSSNKVVWTWSDPAAKQITNVLVVQ